MAIYKGIDKKTYLAPQATLGTPATAGGQELRRVTSVAKQTRQTFANNEIVSHQMSQGANLGPAATDWAFDGLLSPGTYSLPIAACLRDDFTATAASTGVSLTVAGTGSAGGTITITDAANNFLVDGFKIGDVVRITAGTVNAGNLNNNLWLTGVTTTVLTGILLNTPQEGGTAYVPEGPIAACTITSVGKRSRPDYTTHTDKLFTLEEYFSDGAATVITEVFPDMRIGQLDIGLPASGNATIKWSSLGLGTRVIGAATTMVTPTAASTSQVVTSSRGALVVGGVAVDNVSAVTITVNPKLTALGPVVGSDISPDVARGMLEVTGSFTSLQSNSTLMTYFANGTPTTLMCAVTTDTTKNSEFVAFTLSNIKLTGDAPTDGESGISRTYPFTAGINLAGGVALANDQTIISIQDSLAA